MKSKKVNMKTSSLLVLGRQYCLHMRTNAGGQHNGDLAAREQHCAFDMCINKYCKSFSAEFEC